MPDDTAEVDDSVVTPQRPKPRAPPRPWTTQEDSLLREAVAKYGDEDRNWPIIAESVPGRDNKACRKRWKLSLSPELKKTAWTKEEDELLLKLHAEYPCRWSLIAKQISGRTDDACAKRYRDALDPSIKQGQWSEEEDQRLLEEYKRWGGRWATVAQQLGRSSLHCRNRWRLLERKKARRNSSSPESDPGDSVVSDASDMPSTSQSAQEATPLSSNDAPLETSQTDSQPSSSTQWSDLFDQFALYSTSSTSSMNTMSEPKVDMDIPIDPSLVTMFDSQPSTQFQFDARVWDILNGGCGCGCGSNAGCTCGDESAPPFLDMTTNDFLQPFQHFSRSFPQLPFSEGSSSQQGLLPTTQPLQLIEGEPSRSQLLATPLPLQQQPPSMFGGDASEMNSLTSYNTNTPQVQVNSFLTAGGPPASLPQIDYGNTVYGSGGGSSSSSSHGYHSASVTLSQSSSTLTVTASIPMSPRTRAMYEELVPHMGNIDPAKFVAAVALAKARENAICSPAPGKSCTCQGSCCSATTTSSRQEIEMDTTKGSCCGGGGAITEMDLEPSSVSAPLLLLPSSSSSSLEGKIHKHKRSRSPSTTDINLFDGDPASKRKKNGTAVSSSSSDNTHPRLSSQLQAVAGDSSLKPYACGSPECWIGESGGDIRARFNTSGDLLEHWRREHEGKESEIPNGKVFRCALEGCGKGWKSINGIQYHLQISKAHFAVALNKQVLEGFSSSVTSPSSISIINDQEVSSTATPTSENGDDTTTGKKKYACTHPGCPKVYKQGAGLKYHLSHGHPQTGPVQLAELPPVLSERISQLSTATPTRS